MRYFLEELQATYDCKIYSTALASALLVPDACGTIEYNHIKQNGERYRKFYNNFIRKSPDDPYTLPGEVIWKLRNAMIHETTVNFTEYGFDRIIFTIDEKNVMHMNTMEQWLGWRDDPDGGRKRGKTVQLSLKIFISQIITATNRWLDEVVEFDEQKKSNMERLLQYRPAGMRPYVVGFPVIG